MTRALSRQLSTFCSWGGRDLASGRSRLDGTVRQARRGRPRRLCPRPRGPQPVPPQRWGSASDFPSLDQVPHLVLRSTDGVARPGSVRAGPPGQGRIRRHAMSCSPPDCSAWPWCWLTDYRPVPPLRQPATGQCSRGWATSASRSVPCLSWGCVQVLVDQADMPDVAGKNGTARPLHAGPITEIVSS